jgi:hypothetical protein
MMSFDETKPMQKELLNCIYRILVIAKIVAEE